MRFVYGLALVCFLAGFLQQVQGKRKRSYTKLDFDLMSDERLCLRKRCGKRPKGSWCKVVVNDAGRRTPTCVCPTSCDSRDDSPVCSVFGRQYRSKCAMHVEACKKRKHIKIAYEGACIASQSKCKKAELSQFPFRLLDWFVHLRDTSEFGRVDMSKSFSSITVEEREAVAQWKFGKLDKNHDKKLSKKELKRFRYALMPLEHCAKAFFKICDSDKNKKLTEKEWTKCLVVDSMDWFQNRNEGHSKKKVLPKID